jgi:hypothetical protein
MPTITRANTHAAAVMIAEGRGHDLGKARSRPPPRRRDLAPRLGVVGERPDRPGIDQRVAADDVGHGDR